MKDSTFSLTAFVDIFGGVTDIQNQSIQIRLVYFLCIFRPTILPFKISFQNFRRWLKMTKESPESWPRHCPQQMLHGLVGWVWQIQNQTPIQCWEHPNAVLSECMRRRSWPAVTAIELRSGESAEKCSRKKSEKNYQEIPNKNHYEIQQRIRGEIQKITEKSKSSSDCGRIEIGPKCREI